MNSGTDLLKKLASGVSAYVDGANGLAQSTIDSLGDQVKLAAGIKQLSQGTSGLSDGLTTYRSRLEANAASADGDLTLLRDAAYRSILTGTTTIAEAIRATKG